MAYHRMVFLVFGIVMLAVAVERPKPPDNGTKEYAFECRTTATKITPVNLTVTATAPGSTTPIKNPFYRHPAWRLWFTDASPIGIRRDGEQSTLTVAPADAWKDCYMSLDYGHSDGKDKPAKNCFVGPIYYHPTIFAPPDMLCVFGVNFTAESLCSRGRYIADDFVNIDKTERYFLFANCVRSYPAYKCYSDTDPERAYDEYDALAAHSFQSIGHSAGMMLAIKKMIDAGECMPRATVEKLKTHGLYAPALITLFRAALPFTDALGQPVPYEHELRHRPVYSMSGDCMTYAERWFKANIPYHTYDEKRHAQTMLDLAKRMEIPPPVAVMELAGFSVTKGGATLVQKQLQDERLKSVNKTVIRVWGKEGETLEINVDMRKSIDLMDRPLSYFAHAVYPNQQNVQIKPGTDKGVFKITVQHDKKLPKGRIPVILFVRNGVELPSNPVFINFYWPSNGETQADYPHDPPSYTSLIPADIRINDNLRPIVKFEPAIDASDTILCAPGAQVSFRIQATDPEGYPTTISRWPGEIGTLSKDIFSCAVPGDGKEHSLHFIVSDGTGGFTGKLIKLVPKK